MRLALATVLIALTLADSLSVAQTLTAPTKEALPGLELKPVPDILYAQLPQLPPGHGLVVERVGNEIPTGLSVLQRNDVLLSFDGNALSGVDQLQRLVLAAKPTRKVAMVVLRGGKKLTLSVSANGAELQSNTAKGTIKPGDPPSVDIECTVLNGGKLQITLQYYSETSSKLETLSCKGSLPEIEKQVRDQRLPNRLQEMVDVAFKRLRTAYPR